jgi:hypothetical protein
MNTNNTAAPPSVADYFEQRLGSKLPPAHPGETELDREHPASPAHPEFTIETGCGEDCKKVIDAAADVLKYLQFNELRWAANDAAAVLFTLARDAIPSMNVLRAATAVLAVTHGEAEPGEETIIDARFVAAEVVNVYVYG